MQQGNSSQSEVENAQLNNLTLSPRFPFLSLPLEIRMMLYRLLLSQDKPVTAQRGEYGLCPSILRVCQQALFEARRILYSENTFLISVVCGTAEFLNCFDFAIMGPSIFGSRFEEMRRFHITVMLFTEASVSYNRGVLLRVCKTLSDFCCLDYLHIELKEYDSLETHKFSRVLESFIMLRNVRNVTFEGIPTVYSQYLISKMIGSSPLDHLPKTYDALVVYAGRFDCCEPGLQEACDAMADYDVDRFKRVRKALIALVTERIVYIRDHLFDHDADYTQHMPDSMPDTGKNTVSVENSKVAEES